MGCGNFEKHTLHSYSDLKVQGLVNEPLDLLQDGSGAGAYRRQ